LLVSLRFARIFVAAGPEDAQDRTQSFFARLLERDLLSRAAPQRGRFRPFLLTALQNFLADEHDRAIARKRRAGQPLVSLDALDGEARYTLEPADNVSPDKLFEHRWATTVIEQARTRLDAEYAAEGKADLFRELRRFNSAQESAPVCGRCRRGAFLTYWPGLPNLWTLCAGHKH